MDRVGWKNAFFTPLLTDLYQLTMACGYWKTGIDRKEAVFNLFFRRNPFGGGFAVAAGLEQVLEFVEAYRFEEEDLSYLARLPSTDGRPLFDQGFLDYLRSLRLACDIDAIPEGTVVFPLEPLVRVRGPILHCQLLETALLNILNFQTLVATKAARVVLAARGDPVLEFGLRRAQGVDGGLSASRAAYIGGCSATSNVLAGKVFGIPVRGTHAHSWVMAFDSEMEAFLAWSEAMPGNCTFLVDTYDTFEGVRRAVEVARQMRSRGCEMSGVRLDSGDLAFLSRKVRRILDAAGFTEAGIVASNDLDEYLIETIKQQGGAVNVWGVGTRLVTSYAQPALDGVYKLTAIREPGADWAPRIKLSEQAVKINIPGILQVRRFRSGDECVADMIYDERWPPTGDCRIVDLLDRTRTKRIRAGTPGEDLLVPVARRGRIVYVSPPLAAIRDRTQKEFERFHEGIKRFVNPHVYPVGLEESLYDLRERLIVQARREVSGDDNGSA